MLHFGYGSLLYNGSSEFASKPKLAFHTEKCIL